MKKVGLIESSTQCYANDHLSGVALVSVRHTSPSFFGLTITIASFSPLANSENW